jgi:TRAP-type C4-dicarboxylate transport system permease small subunit
LSMFGAVVGIKNKAHTTIEFIMNIVPKKVRLAFNVIGFLLISVLLWVLIVTGFIVAKKTSFPTATLPFTWTYVYLAVPIGSLLMFIRFVEDVLVRICRNRQSNIIS